MCLSAHQIAGYMLPCMCIRAGSQKYIHMYTSTITDPARPVQPPRAQRWDLWTFTYLHIYTEHIHTYTH